jgi:geranylgeranyl diphosphate synthase type II
MHSFSQLTEKVTRALEGLTFPPSPELLYQPLRYMLQSGGKHIRPVLALMCAELFLQKVEDEHIEASLGVELFHCFTLIHDDIMDKAPLRRGQPTVAARWGANVAILSGDAMLVEAYKLICRSANARALLPVFSRAATEVCEGQQLDMDFEQLPAIGEEQYFAMVGKKTAALLAAAAAIGALEAKAPAADVQRLYRFAYELGLAFQLRDDYLDTFSEASSFGKTTGGDIAAGKKTFLFVATVAALNEQEQSEFLCLMRSNSLPEAEKVLRVKEFYVKANAVRRLHEAENACFGTAMQSLEQVDVPSERKEHLKNLALKLLNRDK